jgi:hypothetical protein
MFKADGAIAIIKRNGIKTVDRTFLQGQQGVGFVSRSNKE